MAELVTKVIGHLSKNEVVNFEAFLSTGWVIKYENSAGSRPLARGLAGAGYERGVDNEQSDDGVAFGAEHRKWLRDAESDALTRVLVGFSDGLNERDPDESEFIPNVSISYGNLTDEWITNGEQPVFNAASAHASVSRARHSSASSLIPPDQMFHLPSGRQTSVPLRRMLRAPCRHHAHGLHFRTSWLVLGGFQGPI